jgi:hypothetical protein
MTRACPQTCAPLTALTEYVVAATGRYVACGSLSTVDAHRNR